MVIAENSAFTMLSFWNLHDKHLFLCPMKRRRYIEGDPMYLAPEKRVSIW